MGAFCLPGRAGPGSVGSGGLNLPGEVPDFPPKEEGGEGEDKGGDQAQADDPVPSVYRDGIHEHQDRGGHVYGDDQREGHKTAAHPTQASVNGGSVGVGHSVYFDLLGVISGSTKLDEAA